MTEPVVHAWDCDMGVDCTCGAADSVEVAARPDEQATEEDENDNDGLSA